MVDTNFCKHILMWMLPYTFLERILCIVLINKEIKEIKLILFVPEWPHWFLNSKNQKVHILYLICIKRWAYSLETSNPFSKECTFLTASTIFLELWFSPSYSHFKHISSLAFNILTLDDKSIRLLGLRIWNHYSKTLKAQTYFQTCKWLICT